MALTSGIEVFGDRPIHSELNLLGDRATDFRPVFQELRLEFYEIEKALFDSQGQTGEHGAWADLAPITIRKKEQAGQDPRILHATLALRRSLTSPNSSGSRGRMTPDYAEFGTTLPYAKYLREGTAHMAARRPVDFTVSQEEGWVARVRKFLMGAWL